MGQWLKAIVAPAVPSTHVVAPPVGVWTSLSAFNDTRYMHGTNNSCKFCENSLTELKMHLGFYAWDIAQSVQCLSRMGEVLNPIPSTM